MLLGAAVLFTSIAIGVHESTSPIAGGVTTDARVVAVRVVSGRYTTDYPTLEFVDRDGVTHRFVGDGGDGIRVGQRIRISYDPADPARTHELDNGGHWVFGIGAGAVFLALGLLAGAVTVRGQLRRRRGV